MIHTFGLSSVRSIEQESNQVIWDGHQSSLAQAQQMKSDLAARQPVSEPVVPVGFGIGPSAPPPPAPYAVPPMNMYGMPGPPSLPMMGQHPAMGQMPMLPASVPPPPGMPYGAPPPGYMTGMAHVPLPPVTVPEPTEQRTGITYRNITESFYLPSTPFF